MYTQCAPYMYKRCCTCIVFELQAINVHVFELQVMHVHVHVKGKVRV